MNTPKDAIRRRRRGDRPDTAQAATAREAGASDFDRADRWQDFIFKISLIVLATLWIYSPAYHGDWLWDDDQSITANAVTQSPWSFRDIWVAPPGADYFPLTATGFWLPWQFFGPRPNMPPAAAEAAMSAVRTVYHVLNILLHILGAFAFWRLLSVMKLPGAWLGALLFAIHPVAIESVAWVSELKNTLSQPLFLLGCSSFIEFDEEQDRAKAAKHYVLSVLFFLFAMFAKTSIVTFPLVILAYGWWKHGFSPELRGIRTLILAGASLALTVVPEMFWLVELRNGRSSWLLYACCTAVAILGPILSLAVAAGILRRSGLAAESPAVPRPTTLERYVLYSLPFFWISAVLGIATCYFQWSRAIGQEAIPVGGVDSRIAIAGMAVLFYLWKTIWPFNLLTIYPRWEVDPPKVWQFLPWPIIIAAGWWLWSNRGTAERPTWQRHMIFVLVFFVLMLLPILGFITISYMRITWVADHFLYAPMISVLAIAVAGIVGWYDRAKLEERPVALATGAILVTVLAYSSFRYAHAWANEEALWPHTIAGHPNPCREGCGCWQAHNRLGAKKFARGDVDAAHYHFQNSTRLRPDLGETHNNLGTTLSARAQRFAQMGNQDAAKREMDAAIEQFTEAVRVTPHVPAIQVNLANALASAGRFGEAADRYKQLIDREPNNPALINNYGVALYRQGLNDAAVKEFRRALELAPNLKDARESLAIALGEKPDPSKSAAPAGSPQGASPGPVQQPVGAPVERLNLTPPVSPTLNASPVLP